MYRKSVEEFVSEDERGFVLTYSSDASGQCHIHVMWSLG